MYYLMEVQVKTTEVEILTPYDYYPSPSEFISNFSSSFTPYFDTFFVSALAGIACKYILRAFLSSK